MTLPNCLVPAWAVLSTNELSLTTAVVLCYRSEVCQEQHEVAPGGHIYHVLNRSAGKRPLFNNDGEFEAFERIMIEAHQRHPLPILAYCLLPRHWQFVVWPGKDGQLSDYFRWLAHTHAMRRKRSRRKAGSGRLYQSRYKSFLIQRDENLLIVLRCVERSSVTAGLVEKAQLWRFGSLWATKTAIRRLKRCSRLGRSSGRRTGRLESMLRSRSMELDRVQVSIERSRPFGTDDWVSGARRAVSAWNTRYARRAGRRSSAIRSSGPTISGKDGFAGPWVLPTTDGPSRNQHPTYAG